jgi:hypothetical protein
MVRHRYARDRNMTEQFADVWLQSAIDVGIDLAATGPYTLRYHLNYFNHRLPSVRSHDQATPQ